MRYATGARRRGLEMGLSPTEFAEIVVRPCEYCGDLSESMGIDRINNDHGYSLDNVAPCCSTCNFMEKTHSRDHFIAHVNKIANHNEARH